MSLTVVATIREILGKGSWLGMAIMPEGYPGMPYLLKPPGAFALLGILLGVMNFVSLKLEAKK